MNSLFCLYKIVFFVFIILYSISCSKNNIRQTQQEVSPDTVKRTPTSQDTLFLSVSDWEKRADGAYASNLSNLIKLNSNTTGSIFAIYITVDDHYLLISPNHVSFQNGELWTGYTGADEMLFYKGPYNQMPFHFLDLEIIIMK